jgi:hypothetical protein
MVTRIQRPRDTGELGARSSAELAAGSGVGGTAGRLGATRGRSKAPRGPARSAPPPESHIPPRSHICSIFSPAFFLDLLGLRIQVTRFGDGTAVSLRGQMFTGGVHRLFVIPKGRLMCGTDAFSVRTVNGSERVNEQRIGKNRANRFRELEARS